MQKIMSKIRNTEKARLRRMVDSRICEGCEVRDMEIAHLRSALEKIAGDMEMPFEIARGKRGNALILAAGEWRREQDRNIAKNALKAKTLV